MDPLLRFRVKNFGSISDWAEISAVASDKSDGAFFDQVSSESVLPALGIYGPNASGKSTIISALAFLRRAVDMSYRSWDPGEDIRRNPHKFGNWSTRPTEYEIDFVAEGLRYRYEVALDDHKILTESLLAFTSRKPQVWFRRKLDHVDFPGNALKGRRKQIVDITRPNSLFLSAGVQAGHPQLQVVARWFRRLAILNPERLPIFLGRESSLARRIADEDERSAFLSLLRFADLGITDIRPVKEEREDSEGRTLERNRIEFTHHGVEESTFNSRDESTGTLTWLDYIGWLTRIIPTGGQLIVDEIDRSLHPILTHELVEIFQDPVRNPRGAQIVFTAHDTSLMDPRLDWPLRRDQVWLTEKNASGATEVHPLLEYAVRPSNNLELWYRQGRFGAIPMVDQREYEYASIQTLPLFENQVE